MRYFKKLFRVLLPIVVLGVLADKFFTFPWEGLSYQVGDIEYQISREWETFGVVRLSGLQRASYDCAIMISLLLVLDCIYMSIYGREKSVIYRCYDMILWIAAAYGIYLTTFKSAYIFIVALVLYRLLIKLYKKMVRKYKFVVELILKFFLLCILVYALLPPILSIMGRELFDTSDASFLYQFLFASYSVRMSVTWPKAVGLLDLAKFNGFLGRGIGGIGTAQQHGEKALYCAGDNVFIILYVILGVVSVIFILGIIITILKTKFTDKQGYIIYYLLILFLCFGATVSVLDSPMLMSGLGLLLACYTEVGIDVDGYENDSKKSKKRSKILR